MHIPTFLTVVRVITLLLAMKVLLRSVTEYMIDLCKNKQTITKLNFLNV